MGKKKIKNKKKREIELAINSSNYSKDFLPVYSRLGTKPDIIIQFPIIIPFHIPFKSGTCLTFGLDDGQICTFHFSDLISSTGISAGIVGYNSIKVPIKKNRVEMLYGFSSNSSTEISEDDLTSIFDTLLALLNKIIVSYLTYKKDIHVYQITKEMLEFSSFFRVVMAHDWKVKNEGLFLLHMNAPYEKVELSEQDHEEIAWYSDVIIKGLNPFILSEELILNADRNFDTGFYKEAILFAQSSVETFINILFKKILDYEGKSEAEISNIFEDISFMKIIKREMPNRLGGSWNPENNTNEVGSWNSKCYEIRNRIIHGGYLPTFAETDDAISAAKEFRMYIIKLIRANKKKYPSLNDFFTERKSKGEPHIT